MCSVANGHGNIVQYFLSLGQIEANTVNNEKMAPIRILFILTSFKFFLFECNNIWLPA